MNKLNYLGLILTIVISTLLIFGCISFDSQPINMGSSSEINQ